MAKELIALLMLLRVRMTDGMDLAPTYEELAPRGLSVDRTRLTTTWLMVGILVSVVSAHVTCARLSRHQADRQQTRYQQEARSSSR